MFGITQTALRKARAGRKQYPLTPYFRHITHVRQLGSDELSPELRGQRIRSKQRVQAIIRSIVNNPTGYTLSSLIASIARLGTGCFWRIAADGRRNSGRLPRCNGHPARASSGRDMR